MKATKSNSLVLALISCGAIFAGCGSSGGGGDDESSNAVFSPAAYQEATSANESLSGIWLMLEEYDFNSEETYPDRETNTPITETHHSKNKRRGLFVITDADVSPTGTPRISGCDRPQDFVVSGNSVSFLDDAATYTATLSSNTRISGSSQYEENASDRPHLTQSGRFTLIKLAPLATGFEIDASSDAYGNSYTKTLEPVGTLAAQGQYAGTSEGLDASGPVRCFTHTEGSYTTTESPGQTTKGSYVRFWAGTSDGLEVDIYQDKPESGTGYMQIDADVPPYSNLEIDNSVFGEITGTSTLSISGSRDISVDGSISGATEGDIETSIDINLP